MVGFSNVRTLRRKRDIGRGPLEGIGEEKLELLKERMRELRFYVLASSEVRLDGQGTVKHADGY
eukprot:9423600-Karenia_brevis.AAC.1